MQCLRTACSETLTGLPGHWLEQSCLAVVPKARKAPFCGHKERSRCKADSCGSAQTASSKDSDEVVDPPMSPGTRNGQEQLSTAIGAELDSVSHDRLRATASAELSPLVSSARSSTEAPADRASPREVQARTPSTLRAITNRRFAHESIRRHSRCLPTRRTTPGRSLEKAAMTQDQWLDRRGDNVAWQT